jgi:hypothetical protein
LIQKKIPSTGETIPIIGVGTARRYEEITPKQEKRHSEIRSVQFKELGGTDHRFVADLRNRRGDRRGAG